MAQSPLLETKHAAEFLVSYAAGHRSFDRGIITGAALLVAGTVLGRKTVSGAGTATATAGNTGNGAMGAVTVSGPAKLGTYMLRITKAATNAGDFEVIEPDGDVLGLGSVAAPFNTGGLAFTLADGATDFVAGDSFSIVVTGTQKYAVYDPAAVDGTQYVAGILYATADATAADVTQTVVTRAAEVNASELTWKSGMTNTQIAAGAVALANLGIIPR